MAIPGIKERIGDPGEQQRSHIENELANARFAMPGIVVGFDADRQTASVQPAVTENVQIGDGPPEEKRLPILSDVPVQFPRGGGYCLTFPVADGDECMLVFGDMCIDGWWRSGGVQSQMEKRRHDLSDAMAIMGISCAPRAISGSPADGATLRKEDGSAVIELRGGEISISAATAVNVDAPAIRTSGTLSHDGDVNVSGTIAAAEVSIEGMALSRHVHGGVAAGPGDTGAPR